MKPYANFLIGLSFFWASITITNVWEQPFFSLPLCFFLHTLFSTNTLLHHFFALLACLEFNMLHGSCLPPLVALIALVIIGQFVKKTTQLPLLVLRIMLLAMYLRLEQNLAFLLLDSPLPGYKQFLYTFAVSSAFLIALAIFLPEVSEKKKNRIT